MKPRPSPTLSADSWWTLNGSSKTPGANGLARDGRRLREDLGGSIVPMQFYRRDARVLSVMVEVNRRLYMDEQTGERTAGLEMVRRHVATTCRRLVALAAMQMADEAP